MNKTENKKQETKQNQINDPKAYDPSKFKPDMSDTELEIMDFLWNQNMRAVSLREITRFFNDERSKNWKQQAIRVFLARLKDKGYINVYIDTETKRYVYVPKQTRKEYLHEFSRKILGKFFNNSVTDFMAAFSGNEEISSDEADELRGLLEE